MSRVVRRRIAAACILVSVLIVAASIAELITGHANLHAAAALAFGAASIAGGLVCLRSTRSRP